MIKVGIFFGGPSREREISFAGGRTVYDNLDKALFEPVLIFVDSLKNFIELDWRYVYKGTIRDFYPPINATKPSPHNFQTYIESQLPLADAEIDNIISKVGKRLSIEEVAEKIDFAFLALHGIFGEDGSIQGLMETLEIPYSGSGILPSALGMNKAIQKQLMLSSGWPTPKFTAIKRAEWFQASDKQAIQQKAMELVGDKLVIRPANQGSSIGVAILENPGEATFNEAVDKGFFLQTITKSDWIALDEGRQVEFIRQLTDIREGVGLPVKIRDQIIRHPEELLDWLNEHFDKTGDEVLLEGLDGEQEVIVESFIEGKEFSCIVVRNDDGKPLALPPTEIVKGKEVFDYRSKYLPGLSRKITPINLPDEQIEAIRKDCEKLYEFFGFHVYARIDGFIQEDGTIYLNDPNTTSGMLPSSFFFHQAAEIGLNPSQFLTYIIATSLIERKESDVCKNAASELIKRLEDQMILMRSGTDERLKIGVILGGISSERHISVESGRNIFEKLASSKKYEPIPIFLTGSLEQHELYEIPINILLKDNADDIREKIKTFHVHPIIEKIKSLGKGLTEKYTSNAAFEPMAITYEQLAEMVDGVFIALHGRPGEDGAVQKKLDSLNIPYNGSSAETSQITINKFETNQLLRNHGLKVAEQTLLDKEKYSEGEDEALAYILSRHEFPIIAKPVDEGCSSAVKKIMNREELSAYLHLIFRNEEALNADLAKVLQLKPKEEFPASDYVLLEDFIGKGDAKYFLEVTGGMLTHPDGDGITFEVFEPSEALAGGAVLSLEEKFLAGEGQNITPARFGVNVKEYKIIAEKVKQDLEKAARTLNVEGYCRIDAFVKVYENMEVETMIIEINSLPGMTPATCIFHQAAINGYKPYDFIDKILDFSFKKRHVASN